jgi:hypothetical protein
MFDTRWNRCTLFLLALSETAGACAYLHGISLNQTDFKLALMRANDLTAAWVGLLRI